jgi:ferrous iron transport protein B
MATRTIPNWKERIITIMVTPLMSCSARLPVYTLLISLVVPSEKVLGFLNLQGLILMALYMIGFIAAILTALLMKFVIKARERSFFIMELPVYRAPRWSSVGLGILEKVKVFVFEAGKVIVAISIVLWVLSSHAPGDRFQKIEEQFRSPEFSQQHTPEELEKRIATEKLEQSYAGIMGHAMEPVIRPLGFDWKIGIASGNFFCRARSVCRNHGNNLQRGR